MKKAIVSVEGWVSQIVEPGEDFEIYEGPDAQIAWVDAPDEIQLDWTLEFSPSKGQMVWVERDAPWTDNKVARKVAYGQIEEQLDLIFHDIEQHGQLDQNGAWYKHVTSVKAMIEKPQDPVMDPIQMTPEYLNSLQGTVEPDPLKPNIPSNADLPAWVRYPGWKGYRQA